MKKKLLFALVAAIPIALLLFGASHAAPPAKDKIRVGWVTSLSGPECQRGAGDQRECLRHVG